MQETPKRVMMQPEEGKEEMGGGREMWWETENLEKDFVDRLLLLLLQRRPFIALLGTGCFEHT